MPDAAGTRKPRPCCAAEPGVAESVPVPRRVPESKTESSASHACVPLPLQRTPTFVREPAGSVDALAPPPEASSPGFRKSAGPKAGMARPNRPPAVSLYVSDQAPTGESARTRIRKAPSPSSVEGVATAAVPWAGIEKGAESRTAPPTQNSTVPAAGNEPVTKTVVSKRAERPAPFAPGPPQRSVPWAAPAASAGPASAKRRVSAAPAATRVAGRPKDSPDGRTVSLILELRSVETCLRPRRCTSHDTADAPP